MGEISMSGSMRAASFGWRLLYADLREVGSKVLARRPLCVLTIQQKIPHREMLGQRGLDGIRLSTP